MNEDNEKKQHDDSEFKDWLAQWYETLGIRPNASWNEAYDAWYARQQTGGQPLIPPPPPIR